MACCKLFYWYAPLLGKSLRCWIWNPTMFTPHFPSLNVAQSTHVAMEFSPTLATLVSWFVYVHGWEFTIFPCVGSLLLPPPSPLPPGVPQSGGSKTNSVPALVLGYSRALFVETPLDANLGLLCLPVALWMTFNSASFGTKNSILLVPSTLDHINWNFIYGTKTFMGSEIAWSRRI